MCIVKAAVWGSGVHLTKLVKLQVAHLAHAKVEPPLCRLHGSVGLVQLLLQDLLGVGLLGHVGGHQVVPVGLGGEDVVDPAASHGNHLAHGLLLVDAIVRDVGRGVKGGHGDVGLLRGPDPPFNFFGEQETKAKI